MWSKYVSNNQAISFGSQLLTGGQLYNTVNNVFWDNKFLPSVSRAYSGQHQISCTIFEHKSDNNYLTERKGISFGVRIIFVTTPEGDGVVMVPEPLYGGESEQDQLIVSCKGLKYLPPDLTLLDNVHPTKDMRGLFRDHMEFDQMIDEVMISW